MLKARSIALCLIVSLSYVPVLAMRVRRLAKWLLTSPFVLTEDNIDINWFRAQALTPTLSQREREKDLPPSPFSLQSQLSGSRILSTD